MKRFIFLLVTAVLLVASGKSQANRDSLYFFQLLDQAENLYSAKKYEAAIPVYKMAYELAEQKKMLNYYAATNCLLAIGDCYYNSEDYPKAHEYYYTALLNARNYPHHAKLKNTALRILNQLHQLIQQKDIAFPYPDNKASEEQAVFFTLGKVLRKDADSVLVEIDAGSYDGIILDKNSNASLYAVADTGARATGDYMGAIQIVRIDRNKTIARVLLTDPSTVIQPGWQVKLLVNIPVPVKGSGLADAYRYNYQWKTIEDKLNIFNQRFFYYFGDDKLEADIMDVIKDELKIIAGKFGADTVNKESMLGKPIGDGIFKGKNVIKALSVSNNTSIRYFLHFMSNYYASYFGKPYRFSEIYATWIVYNAELDRADIGKYILGDEKKSADMILRASLVMRQAEKENMPAAWIDESLELVDKSYWNSLLSKSRLLYHYGVASKRKDCIGWSNFFDAVRFRSFGYEGKSDTALAQAYTNFSEAGYTEGMQWINTVKPALTDTATITLNIQRSHSLSYDVYTSPNQRYFATAGEDYTIKIWDISLGKQIHSIDAHNDEIVKLAYNPGGRYLASLSLDSSIKIWNSFTYGLMNTFKPATRQRVIKFSPDGKYLVSTGYDSTINFWEPFTGKLERSFPAPAGWARDFSFDPRMKDRLYLVCSDSAVYSYRLDTLEIHRELKSDFQPILTFYFSKDGKYACYYRQDSSFSIINMAENSIFFTSKVFSWKTSGSLYFSDGAFSPDSRFFVFCRNDSNTVFVNLDQHRSVGLYGTPVAQYSFNSNGNYFIRHYIGNPVIVDFSSFDFDKTYHDIYIADDKFDKWKETYFSLKEKEFENESPALLETRFSSDDQSLIYLSWNAHKLDLGTGRTELLYPAHHWMSGTHQYPEKDYWILYKDLPAEDTLYLFDNKAKKLLAALSIPGCKKITSFSFFEQDKFCMLGGENGSIACWNLQEMKITYVKNNINGYTKPIQSLLLQPGTQHLIAFGTKLKPLVIDSRDGSVVDSIAINSPDRASFTADKLFFTADSGSLLYADPVTYAVSRFKGLHTNKNFLTDIKVSSNGKYLYLLDDPFCYVLETSGLKLVNRFTASGKNLTTLSVSHNDSLLVIGSTNGQFMLYRPFTGRLVCTAYLTTGNDILLTDSSTHYLATKKALRSVVFSQGYKTYNYDQFDLQLNQPHAVLAAIGVAPASLVASYKKAYEKRIQRNGLSLASIAPGRSPSIILLNSTAMIPTTSRETYTVEVECFDFRNKLAELKVFVNDVPYQEAGAGWTSLDTTSRIFEINVPLTTGNNRIKIYCINKLGVSSYKEMLNVYCTAKNQKQQTFFIGLGVNRYVDKTNNLTYSVKDIRDLARSFKKLYPDIIIDTLMNEKVTLKNIILLKERMKRIKVTDKVIMAVTGHGLLSDSLDFYYATYDVDFKDPVKKGLKYEDLENMLSATAARQRLLLIDACHSGLLDKASSSKDTMAGIAKVKNGRGLGGVLSEASEANSFSLMQNLFADFSNDKGIVVIAAAGGLEYAFESSKWRNGVFTYCILKGLEEKEADKTNEGGDNDGHVGVQELMRYVSNKVPALTGGKQQPTSRRENLDFDWVIK